MGEIRLGKIHLRWCDHCDVPVLEQGSCGICGGPTRPVKITPPGDARPAFESDVERTRKLIDDQFGPGSGRLVLPEGHIVLLNKAPDIDRMDEVIVHGEVVGAVRFSLATGERFLLRPASALAIGSKAVKGWVKVDSGAVEAIRKNKASTLAIGVEDCDPSIRVGTEVLVLGPDGAPVSVGTSKMGSAEMMAHRRGTAVKTRWTTDPDARARQGNIADWTDVVAANKEVLGRRVSESKEFIRRIVRDNDLPVAVSYSGGKDSLATLMLVLEAGVKPKLMFVDTGLEFAETVENVEQVARDNSLELVVESAGDTFWKNIGLFGPPAKDYRWCCKTCKLGPATRLIQKNFPDGVLSFIGQRAYESEQRSKKGSVWRNPWTPNQLGASPIQRWTALHVWLYLMSRRARPNPLYERGLERIGCFMCPASDLSELRRVREIVPQYARWQDFIERYAESKGRPREWTEHDLWRWRRIPRSVTDELGLSLDAFASGPNVAADEESLEFKGTSGYSPCVEGISMEGVFSTRLDMDRVANMMNILGEVTRSPDGSIVEVQRITVFSEGPVMVKAKDEAELKAKVARTKEIVFRAMNCAGCGICVARCNTGALRLDGRVLIDEALCTHCGSCLGKCPVVSFKDEELDI